MSRVALLGLFCVVLVGCPPGQRVNNIPGFEKYDGELPAETSNGDEPQLLVANIVTGRPGYFEFHIDGPAMPTHIFIAVDDDVYVADVDDLELIGACAWIDAANSGSIDAQLMGMLTDCTPECEEACDCFQECNELPTDLGIVGSPSALCTASCSQSGGAIDPIEFGETFSDIYGCQPTSCASRPQWIGMIEVNYPEIQSEAIMAQPVRSETRGSLSPGNFEAGTISTGRPQMCRPF